MNLKTKKLKLQIKKIETNIFEYEVKIEERLEDIERIKSEITISQKAIEELKETLKGE